MATPTQTQHLHPWRATLQTVFQTLIGLAAAMPLIVGAITGTDPARAVGAAAVALTVAAAVTRIMAIPAVDQALARIGLATTPTSITAPTPPPSSPPPSSPITGGSGQSLTITAPPNGTP